MAKITIEEIQKELDKDGWKILSTSYQNLKEELVFMCNEGHLVFSNWEKIRKKRECPLCKNNIYIQNNVVSDYIKKNKDDYRILAIDQASRATGWAIFDSGKLIKYGMFNTIGDTTEERINNVKHWLINQINNWKPDLIGFEDIQLQYGGNTVGVTTYKILAFLLGILIDTSFELKIPYKIIPPATWRSFCEVKGQTRTDKKRSMQNNIKKWYDVSVSNDEADAIGIGHYLSSTIKKKTKMISWE